MTLQTGRSRSRISIRLQAYCHWILLFVLVVCFWSVPYCQAFQRSLIRLSRVRTRPTLKMISNERKITIINNFSFEKFDELGIKNWSVWSCKKSVFPWAYDETENCFILEGSAIITPTGEDSGQPSVTIRKGDYCTFPAGLTCTWEITEDIRKHYNFS